MSPLYSIFRFSFGNIDFFEQYFNGERWHDYLKNIANYGARFDRMAISGKDFSDMPMPFPTLTEQQKIAAFLRAVDEKIAALKHKQTLLEAYKKGVMQLLFSQTLRFTRADGGEFPEWEEKRLGDVAVKKSSSLASNSLIQNSGQYPVFGASGITAYVDFFDEQEAYISIVKDGAGVGRLALCPAKSSALGTLDKIIAKNENNLLFVFYMMQNIDYKKYITGSTIPHVYFSDYSSHKLELPHPDEQQLIANFLTSLDTKIDAISKQIIHWQAFKKGLLQHMFV